MESARRDVTTGSFATSKVYPTALEALQLPNRHRSRPSGSMRGVAILTAGTVVGVEV